jgi:hypothetical protein
MDAVPVTVAIARILLFAGSSLCAASAQAQVYKCAGDGGTPVYQEAPCPPGKELRNFQADPPQITVLPAPTFTAPPPRAGGAAPSEGARTKAAPATPNATLPKGDAAERKHIRAGMSEAEVIARLGQPDVTSGNKNRKGSRWTYLPAAGDPDTITSLTFVNGTVTAVDRKLYRK